MEEEATILFPFQPLNPCSGMCSTGKCMEEEATIVFSSQPSNPYSGM